MELEELIKLLLDQIYAINLRIVKQEHERDVLQESVKPLLVEKIERSLHNSQGHIMEVGPIWFTDAYGDKYTINGIRSDHDGTFVYVVHQSGAKSMDYQTVESLPVDTIRELSEIL